MISSLLTIFSIHSNNFLIGLDKILSLRRSINGFSAWLGFYSLFEEYEKTIKCF